MKTKYLIKADRNTIVRYAYYELGAALANHQLKTNPKAIPCAHLFGASKTDGSFSTRKAAEQFARRMEMFSAFVAGKLGKKNFGTVYVITN